eukprot:10182728-Lingulodinium_polyedra.AAC.1
MIIERADFASVDPFLALGEAQSCQPRSSGQCSVAHGSVQIGVPERQGSFAGGQCSQLSPKPSRESTARHTLLKENAI